MNPRLIISITIAYTIIGLVILFALNREDHRMELECVPECQVQPNGAVLIPPTSIVKEMP